MNNMKLYLLERFDDIGYDEYDSCVVVASSEKEARKLSPGSHGWSDSITVTYLGKATRNIKTNSIIIASYNAG